MEKVKVYLEDLSNKEIAHSETKVEQKASRQIKEQLTSLLCDMLQSLNSDNVQVMRTTKGIGIAIDNENVGFIPLELSVVVKDLTYEIAEENIAYNEKVESDKAKALAKQKEKEAKIAKQKAIKIKEKELKELKG